MTDSLAKPITNNNSTVVRIVYFEFTNITNTRMQSFSKTNNFEIEIVSTMFCHFGTDGLVTLHLSPIGTLKMNQEKTGMGDIECAKGAKNNPSSFFIINKLASRNERDNNVGELSHANDYFFVSSTSCVVCEYIFAYEKCKIYYFIHSFILLSRHTHPICRWTIFYHFACRRNSL